MRFIALIAVVGIIAIVALVYIMVTHYKKRNEVEVRILQDQVSDARIALRTIKSGAINPESVAEQALFDMDERRELA